MLRPLDPDSPERPLTEYDLMVTFQIAFGYQDESWDTWLLPGGEGG